MFLVDSLNREPTVRVLRALNEYGSDSPPAIGSLIEVLRNRSLPMEIRWNAARTLGKIRESGVPTVSVLIEHLLDKKNIVWEHTDEALGDIGPRTAEGVPRLVGVLNDPATRVRRDGVRSLGQISTAAAVAVPDIAKLLEDPEAIVRGAAKTALELLTSGDE